MPTTGYESESHQKRPWTLHARRRCLQSARSCSQPRACHSKWRPAVAIGQRHGDLNAQRRTALRQFRKTCSLRWMFQIKETRVFALLMLRPSASITSCDSDSRRAITSAGIVAQLMHTSTALQAERTLAEGTRTPRRNRHAHQGRRGDGRRAGRLQVLLLATMGERQWLRDQLASVLQRQLTLRKRAATERAERTELMSQILAT